MSRWTYRTIVLLPHSRWCSTSVTSGSNPINCQRWLGNLLREANKLFFCMLKRTALPSKHKNPPATTRALSHSSTLSQAFAANEPRTYRGGDSLLRTRLPLARRMHSHQQPSRFQKPSLPLPAPPSETPNPRQAHPAAHSKGEANRQSHLLHTEPPKQCPKGPTQFLNSPRLPRGTEADRPPPSQSRSLVLI